MTRAGKAHLKELRSELGQESEPATTATARMLGMCLRDGGVIDKRFEDPFVASREKVQFVAEGVGGCRIGEVAKGVCRRGVGPASGDPLGV